MKRTCLFLFVVACIVTLAINASASDEERDSLKGDDDHGGKPAAGMDWKGAMRLLPELLSSSRR